MYKIKAKLILYNLLFLSLLSCNPDLDYIVRGYTEKIIVEGKIETGQYPIVYLSLNFPLWQAVDSALVLKNIIGDAKVTVSDGENFEILTSKWDRTSFPPHYYKGNRIRGEEGKKYYLTVEKGGYTVSATTTIPRGFNLLDIQSKSIERDTLRKIELTIDAGNDLSKAYRLFTKKSKDIRYVETPILFNSTLSQKGVFKMMLSPFPLQTDSSYREGQYFVKGDSVNIKICAIDSVSTMFYRDLAMFSVKGGNIFVSEVKPLKSNISQPGFGIWCGAATKTIRYVVQ